MEHSFDKLNASISWVIILMVLALPLLQVFRIPLSLVEQQAVVVGWRLRLRVMSYTM